MARVLSCRDVGVSCDWQACAETDDELMRLAAEHARTDHGMTEIPPDLAEKARKAIREQPGLCR